MKKCKLCKTKEFPFLITFCHTHPDSILMVSTEHKKEFNGKEKELIERMFPTHKIRWKMNSIPDHAHAHLK